MNIDSLVKKWAPVLDHPDLGAIKDTHRRAVTAQLLENQEIDSRTNGSAGYRNPQSLLETAPTNAMGASSSTASDGAIDIYDPVLISLIRRAAPNLIAYDIAGVQPMTGPTGLIFAMRSRYAVAGQGATGTEALFNEANTTFSGTNSGNTIGTLQTGATPALANATNYTVGTGMTTAQAEALGDGAGNHFNEMAFSIEKISVVAKSRALKAEYTMELAQDLKAVHGLRRGKGNIMICSSDVASALQMAGVLDYTPALANNLQVDDTGNTFAGVLNGRIRVYIDPYFAASSGVHYATMGYKGTSAFDAGLFYCPYVPLQMVRAVGQDTFQPKIGFKTRYGMVANPFATSAADGTISFSNKNIYYRRFAITNLM
ncbi:ATP-binding protein [bacterium]|nr:ATP-binding protein [bacterium]